MAFAHTFDPTVLRAPTAPEPVPEPSLWQGLYGVWLRDLRLALRRRVDTVSVLVFFVLVASLFPLGVGSDAALLPRLGPGVVWVAALLACTLPLKGARSAHCQPSGVWFSWLCNWAFAWPICAVSQFNSAISCSFCTRTNTLAWRKPAAVFWPEALSVWMRKSPRLRSAVTLKFRSRSMRHCA